MRRKGIILAGGKGTRLLPVTKSVNKHLLPVFDKPLIYFPLATLMLAGIRETLIITNPQDLVAFKRLLGDGSQWGVSLSYAIQPEPRGVAEAFLVGENFLEDSPCCLILGDNIFYGPTLKGRLENAAAGDEGGSIFLRPVENPADYGVAEVSPEGRVLSIEEKPECPRSSLVVTGLYFYDSSVCKIAAALEPSGRGELEITDLNREYLKNGKLRAEILDEKVSWIDCGTPERLLEAGNLAARFMKGGGPGIADLEAVALGKGFIGRGCGIPQLEDGDACWPGDDALSACTVENFGRKA